MARKGARKKKAGTKNKAPQQRKSAEERQSDALSELAKRKQQDQGSSAEESDDTTSEGGDAPLGGIYEIYREATVRVLDWLEENCKEVPRLLSIANLGGAANAILHVNVVQAQLADFMRGEEPFDEPIVPPKTILEDISLCLHYRERFSETTGVHGSESHESTIEVLRGCQRDLRYARDVARIIRKRETGNAKLPRETGDADGGGENDDDDDSKDDDDDEEDLDEIGIQKMIDSNTFPKYKEPIWASKMSLEDHLIQADDRTQARMFLDSLDLYMGALDAQFEQLKEAFRVGDFPAGGPVEEILVCAAAANQATESIHHAEAMLVLDHPHLQTFYHVLAIVLWPATIHQLKRLMGAVANRVYPHAALNLVTTAVEAAFRENGLSYLLKGVVAFCQATGVKEEEATKQGYGVYSTMEFDTQWTKERETKYEGNLKFQKSSNFRFRPHGLMAESDFIGGSRCILNTLRQLQRTIETCGTEQLLTSQPGRYGTVFHEDERPAETLQGGLDDTFSATILPALFEICQSNRLRELPDSPQLLTILTLLDRQLSGSQSAPISAALLFGLHAVLTSVFVVQGNGRLDCIARLAKETFHNVFRQVKAWEEPTDGAGDNSPTAYTNIATCLRIGEIPSLQEDGSSISEKGELLGLWNPVVGGGFLLHAICGVSVGYGSTNLDSLGQLRSTLHLYNALRERSNGELKIPFLDEIDRVFDTNEGVWPASRPTKGNFGNQYFLAWGMRLEEISAMGSESKSTKKVIEHFVKKTMMTKKRDSTEVEPQHFCLSYRRLVRREFTENGLARTMTTRLQQQIYGKLHPAVTFLMYRIVTMRDAVLRDKEFVLPVNFVAVGSILLDFINQLSGHMSWDDGIGDAILGGQNTIVGLSKILGKGPHQSGFMTSDIQYRSIVTFQVMGMLLFQIDEKKNMAGNLLRLRTTDIDNVQGFLVDYFKNLSVDKYRLFGE